MLNNTDSDMFSDSVRKLRKFMVSNVKIGDTSKMKHAMKLMRGMILFVHKIFGIVYNSTLSIKKIVVRL